MTSNPNCRRLGGGERRHAASVRALALGLLLTIAAACGASGPSAAGDGDMVEGRDDGEALVDPARFAELADDPRAIVVNVHVPYEGEIPGTDLFVAFDEVADENALPADLDVPLLVYCRSGNMSAEAARTLSSMGHRSVVDLDGGMNAWEADGRDLENRRG